MLAYEILIINNGITTKGGEDNTLADALSIMEEASKDNIAVLKSCRTYGSIKHPSTEWTVVAIWGGEYRFHYIMDAGVLSRVGKGGELYWMGESPYSDPSEWKWTRNLKKSYLVGDIAALSMIRRLVGARG